MGELWTLIRAHMDASVYRPSERTIATKLGIAPNALSNWKNLKRLPLPANLHKLADVIGTPYRVVLNAALIDTGYLEKDVMDDGADRPAPTTQAGSVTDSQVAPPPPARSSRDTSQGSRRRGPDGSAPPPGL